MSKKGKKKSASPRDRRFEQPRRKPPIAASQTATEGRIELPAWLADTGMALARDPYAAQSFREFVDAWWGWSYGGSVVPLPRGWRTKVGGLCLLGASGDAWRLAVNVAMGRLDVDADRTFAYAVGVVWNILIDLDSEPGDAIGSPVNKV